MSEQNIVDEPSNIYIRRPFAPKTLKQLDRQQIDINRRLKRKERRRSSDKIQQIGSHYQVGSSSDEQIMDKLQEVVLNGNRIIAEWKNDQIHGMAQIHYQNGIYFKGLYQNGIKVKGHFKFETGFQYIGNCFGNKFAGKGTLIFPTKKTIQGEWKNFQVIGSGKISYPQGEVYYGEIKEFKKDGKGHFYFTDGRKYEGEFKDGQITGKGSYYIKGNLASAGKWLNGQLIEELTLDNQQRHFQEPTFDKTFVKREDENSITNEAKQINQKNTHISPTNPKNKKCLEAQKDAKKVCFN